MKLLVMGVFLRFVKFERYDREESCKKRNGESGSKSTNHSAETRPFDPVERNVLRPAGLLNLLTGALNSLTVFKLCRCSLSCKVMRIDVNKHLCDG